MDIYFIDSSDYIDYCNQLKENNMTNKVWVCKVCGYVYDGDTPFEDLPADWVCPLCGVGKDDFEQQDA